MAISDWLSNLWDNILAYLPTLITAIIFFVVGWWLAKVLTRWTNTLLKKKKTDISLRKFLVSLTSGLLKIFVVIFTVVILGLSLDSFAVIFGAIVLALGFALQGSLSNFAGGIIILTFRPFKIGDYILTQGLEGTVQSIEVFNTIIKTIDNKTIILPNGNLSNSDVTNFTTEPLRRIDLDIGVSYDADIAKTRKVFETIIKSQKKALKKPAHEIHVSELGDSSVGFKLRVWCNNPDYWDIKFSLIESIKIELDKNKIGIPYPQRDVHVYNH